MPIKVVFMGNPLGGDDGIGPYLYNELLNHPKLKDFELMELGVIGFDLLSYVDEDDKLIIVDAVRSDSNIGKVILLGEKDLSPSLSLVSQHDFGIEETAVMLRWYKPGIQSINIIGIQVNKIKSFSDMLSKELMGKIPKIKAEVVGKILDLAKENK